MASGLPVLASDIPVLREVGGDAALWFDPYDPASIAAAMTVAATQPERLEGLAAAGRGQAARFSWRRMADETLAVFHAVAGRSQRPNAWRASVGTELQRPPR